jgi:hypothetical protein
MVFLRWPSAWLRQDPGWVVVGFSESEWWGSVLHTTAGRTLAGVEVKPREGGDSDALVVRAQEGDAWAMRPLPSWHRGPAAIGEFLTSFGFSERWRHRPTGANGQPARGCYTVDPATGTWVASALAVLSLRGERIAEVDYFLTAELLGRRGDNSSIDGAEMFARFGLPAIIPLNPCRTE